MGWRRDHFSGLGKLEGDVQLCVTSRERLQSKTSMSALLPEISHMGKLVLGESLGSGGLFTSLRFLIQIFVPKR